MFNPRDIADPNEPNTIFILGFASGIGVSALFIAIITALHYFL